MTRRISEVQHVIPEVQHVIPEVQHVIPEVQHVIPAEAGIQAFRNVRLAHRY